MKKEQENLLIGRRGAAEILSHSPERIEVMYLQEGLQFPDDISEGLRGLKNAKRQMVTRFELDELCGGNVHQGIAFLLKPKSEITLKALLNKCLSEQGILLVLDQISDPQNYGAILRVAETAGVSGVIKTDAKSSPMTPAVKKISAGATEILDIHTASNLQRALKEIKEAGIWVVGTSLGEGSKVLYEAGIPFPCAVVLGAEGSGIRQLTAKECDFLVSIPMRGKIDSLNVSHAAAVVLFELNRQRDSQ